MVAIMYECALESTTRRRVDIVLFFFSIFFHFSVEFMIIILITILNYNTNNDTDGN